jgi:hypothetical protein
MEHFLHAMGDNMMWTVGGVIAIVAIISCAIKDVIRTSKREASRREIAAYIAEGSMTPEQGERLMRSGPDSELS